MGLSLCFGNVSALPKIITNGPMLQNPVDSVHSFLQALNIVAHFLLLETRSWPGCQAPVLSCFSSFHPSFIFSFSSARCLPSSALWAFFWPSSSLSQYPRGRLVVPPFHSPTRGPQRQDLCLQTELPLQLLTRPSCLGVTLLQKPVFEKPSTTLGELENSGLLWQWAQRS